MNGSRTVYPQHPDMDCTAEGIPKSGWMWWLFLDRLPLLNLSFPLVCLCSHKSAMKDLSTTGNGTQGSCRAHPLNAPGSKKLLSVCDTPVPLPAIPLSPWVLAALIVLGSWLPCFVFFFLLFFLQLFCIANTGVCWGYKAHAAPDRTQGGVVPISW